MKKSNSEKIQTPMSAKKIEKMKKELMTLQDVTSCNYRYENGKNEFDLIIDQLPLAKAIIDGEEFSW